MNKLLTATLVNVHKDVYELKLVEPESKADVGQTLIKAGVAGDSPHEDRDGQAAESQADSTSGPGGMFLPLKRQAKFVADNILIVFCFFWCCFFVCFFLLIFQGKNVLMFRVNCLLCR